MRRRLVCAPPIPHFGTPQDTHNHEAPGSPRGRAARSIAPRQPNGRWYVQATSRSYRDRSIPARHVSRPPARQATPRHPPASRPALPIGAAMPRAQARWSVSPVSLATSVTRRRCSTRLCNERPRSFGDFRQAGDAAARRAGIRIDASEPRNKSAAEQRESGSGVFWNCRIGVGVLQSALNRGFNRSLDAAKRLILRGGEFAVTAVLQIKTFEGEGEQRQRVLGTAGINIAEQVVDQRILDLQRPIRLFQPRGGPFDHFGIGPFGIEPRSNGTLPIESSSLASCR